MRSQERRRNKKNRRLIRFLVKIYSSRRHSSRHWWSSRPRLIERRSLKMRAKYRNCSPKTMSTPQCRPSSLMISSCRMSLSPLRRNRWTLHSRSEDPMSKMRLSQIWKKWASRIQWSQDLLPSSQVRLHLWSTLLLSSNQTTRLIIKTSHLQRCRCPPSLLSQPSAFRNSLRSPSFRMKMSWWATLSRSSLSAIVIRNTYHQWVTSLSRRGNPTPLIPQSQCSPWRFHNNLSCNRASSLQCRASRSTSSNRCNLRSHPCIASLIEEPLLIPESEVHTSLSLMGRTRWTGEIKT